MISPKTIPITRDGRPWLQARRCANTWTRMRGLMFSDPEPALFLFPVRQRVSLHMFFVRFPLTALFLDDHKRVLEIQQLRPWRVGKPCLKPVRYVLEVPGLDPVSIGTQLDW